MEKQETMETELNIERVLDDIESVCEPTSIFLYGSRARTDSTSESDYEIGVLLSEDKYVGRTTLRSAVKDDRVSVYPFKLEQFQADNPDTPFNKKFICAKLLCQAEHCAVSKLLKTYNRPALKQ